MINITGILYMYICRVNCCALEVRHNINIYYIVCIVCSISLPLAHYSLSTASYQADILCDIFERLN